MKKIEDFEAALAVFCENCGNRQLYSRMVFNVLTFENKCLECKKELPKEKMLYVKTSKLTWRMKHGVGTIYPAIGRLL